MYSVYVPSNDADATVWLSGAVATFLNRLLFPALWLGGLAGLLLATLIRNGHILIAPGFRLFALLVVAATVFMLWVSARIERVGYAGTDLVAAVESVGGPARHVQLTRRRIKDHSVKTCHPIAKGRGGLAYPSPARGGIMGLAEGERCNIYVVSSP